MMSSNQKIEVWFAASGSKPVKTPPKLDIADIPAAAITPGLPILCAMIHRALADPLLRAEFEAWRAERGVVSGT